MITYLFHGKDASRTPNRVSSVRVNRHHAQYAASTPGYVFLTLDITRVCLWLVPAATDESETEDGGAHG